MTGILVRPQHLPTLATLFIMINWNFFTKRDEHNRNLPQVFIHTGVYSHAILLQPNLVSVNPSTPDRIRLFKRHGVVKFRFVRQVAQGTEPTRPRAYHHHSHVEIVSDNMKLRENNGVDIIHSSPRYRSCKLTCKQVINQKGSESRQQLM